MVCATCSGLLSGELDAVRVVLSAEWITVRVFRFHALAIGIRLSIGCESQVQYPIIVFDLVVVDSHPQIFAAPEIIVLFQ